MSQSSRYQLVAELCLWLLFRQNPQGLHRSQALPYSSETLAAHWCFCRPWALSICITLCTSENLSSYFACCVCFLPHVRYACHPLVERYPEKNKNLFSQLRLIQKQEELSSRFLEASSLSWDNPKKLRALRRCPDGSRRVSGGPDMRTNSDETPMASCRGESLQSTPHLVALGYCSCYLTNIPEHVNRFRIGCKTCLCSPKSGWHG